MSQGKEIGGIGKYVKKSMRITYKTFFQSRKSSNVLLIRSLSLMILVAPSPKKHHLQDKKVEERSTILGPCSTINTN